MSAEGDHDEGRQRAADVRDVDRDERAAVEVAEHDAERKRDRERDAERRRRQHDVLPGLLQDQLALVDDELERVDEDVERGAASCRPPRVAHGVSSR